MELKKVFLIGLLTLGLVCNCFPQQDPAYFVEKFENYQSTWFKIKLHLIFNQNKYIPGDTAYFKAYFLSENLKGIQGEHVVKLTLIDSNGEIKEDIKFKVIDGKAHNQLIIPKDLKEGNYLFVAYSNWMRNFNPETFFTKEVHVVKQKTLKIKKSNSIKVAVEGGHLIQKVPNQLVLKVSEPNVEVSIVDHSGHEIARGKSNEQGLVNLPIIPTLKANYKVKINEVVVSNMELSEVEEDGVNLLLQQDSSQSAIKINLSAPKSSAYREDTLTMLLSAKSSIKYSVALKLDHRDSLDIQLPASHFDEGIVHISLLAPNGKLLAFRDFYKKGNNYPQVKIVGVKQYHPRQKIKLQVHVFGVDNKPVQGEFSVKVLNKKLFDKSGESNLRAELNLLSSINYEMSLSKNDLVFRKNLDDYLILQSKAIPWYQILKSNPPKPTYSFTKEIVKKGKAYSYDNDEPVPLLSQIMFYLQHTKWRYQTRTYDSGYFNLTIPDFYGDDRIFYVAESIKGEDIKNIKIKWINADKIKLPIPRAFYRTNDEDTYASFMEKSRMINQSYDIFTTSDSLLYRKPDGTGTDNKIKEADITINIEDYIVFPTMADMIKEVIPAVLHRTRKGQDIVRVKLPGQGKRATDDPLYIIDGVATKNTDFFLSLKPADLLSIKIVNSLSKLRSLALLGKNGIIIIETKNGNAGKPLLDSLTVIKGFNKPIEFSVLKEETVHNSNKPFFRSTVYWNPSIELDKNGKAIIEFFSTDDIGTYSVRIDGLSDGGQPFTCITELQVQLKERE